MVHDQDHRDGDRQGPRQLFAGVDWGGSFHQLCVIDCNGVLILQQRIVHDVTGLELLGSRLGMFGAEMLVAIERAEGLLVEFLQTLPAVTLFCVSPKISARARERYRLSASKSDVFDAFVLADTLRQEHARWRPLRPTFHVNCGVAGGFSGPAAGAARQGGLRVATAGGARHLLSGAAAPVLRAGP